MLASTMELVPWLVGYFLIKVVLRLAIGGTAWDHTSLARQLLPSSPPTYTADVEIRACVLSVLSSKLHSVHTDRRLWDPSTNAAMQCSRRTFAARLDFLPQWSAAKERLEEVEWGLVLEWSLGASLPKK
jgi:hypothetical protein